MRTKSALLGALALLLLAGGSSPPAGSTKKESSPNGKKKNAPSQPAPAPGGVLLVGDSQSVAATSPGRRLAALLTAAGHPTRVLAKGGKTAAYFVGKGGGAAELLRELSFRPAWVIVFLGSNEAANVAAFPTSSGALNIKQITAQLKGHQRLKAAIEGAGARALFVGPPAFGPKVKSTSGGLPLNDGAAALMVGLENLYSPNFIDARPLTPAHTGVHFFGKGEAEAFAAALFPSVKAKL